MTVKAVALTPFPCAVNTLILLVVAPEGTVALIWVAVSLVMVAGLVPKATSVAPAKPCPLMVTVAPIGPEVGLTLDMVAS